MLDLSNCTLSDLTNTLTELRKLRIGAKSMEDAAGRLVRYFYDSLLVKETGKRSCALVRLFVTRPFGTLDAELQAIARKMLGGIPESPSHKCLVLLGTAGDQPEWNARKQSTGHQVIPLPSEQIVSNIPMISQLINQLGVDVSWVLQPNPRMMLAVEQKTYNVFHVPEAVGSPYIPAQNGFVIPFHIQSVLGFGGLLPSGELFALILFSRTYIPHETASFFKPHALAVKAALLPFDRDGAIFEGAGQPGNSSLPQSLPTADQLRSETLVLGQLMDVYESTVHEQSSKLRYTIGALEEALLRVKTLKGLLPICSRCKKIRDDQGYWNQLEEYVHEHSEAEFSHGFCPDCMKLYLPQEYQLLLQQNPKLFERQKRN